MSANHYSDLFGLLDDIFTNSISNLPWDVSPIRFNRMIASSDFPPANLLVDHDTKVLTIEVALAGCSENDFNLEFSGDYLILTVDKNVDLDNKQYVIQKGLRTVSKAEVKWTIDPRFYSRDNVKVVYENGLLTVTIFPKEDCKPKKISLFGKLPFSAEDKELED